MVPYGRNSAGFLQSKTLVGAERRRHFLRGDSLLPIAAFVLLMVMWWIAYGATKFLPSPVSVVRSLPTFLTQEGFLGNVFVTLRHVLVSLAISTLLAVISVTLMASSVRVSRVIQVYIFAAFSIPSLAAAIFGLMIFGLSEVGVYFGVSVIIYPFITVGIRDGVANVDTAMLELADVYRFGLWRRLRHVIIPTMEPYLMAALRNAHALAWKVVIIAEVFSTGNGIGGQFSRAFDYFQLNEVIFWLGVFLVCVFIVEYGVLRVVERRLFRWRSHTVFAK